jgi:hypothetical protein
VRATVQMPQPPSQQPTCVPVSLLRAQEQAATAVVVVKVVVVVVVVVVVEVMMVVVEVVAGMGSEHAQSEHAHRPTIVVTSRQAPIAIAIRSQFDQRCS